MADKKSEFQSLIRTALKLNQEFINYWHSVDLNELAKNLTVEDAPMLEELILKRIEVLNLFELLLKIDPGRAKNILVRRYLGESVSPDTKFGGFEFELSTMLDDYNEILGEKALVDLINHPEIEIRRLKDTRVLRSLTEALDFNDENESLNWVITHCKKTL